MKIRFFYLGSLSGFLEILFDDRPGWGIGGDTANILVYYDELKNVFNSFKGKLIFINDCCHSLSIDRHLKFLIGRYLLFGSSRIDSVSRISILDAVLGPWCVSLPAFPRVYAVGSSGGCTIDFPASCIRGSYYDCNCGSLVKIKTVFEIGKGPSLRRGVPLDYLFYPKTKP